MTPECAFDIFGFFRRIPVGVPFTMGAAVQHVERGFLEILSNWLSLGKLLEDRPRIIRTISKHSGLEIPEDTPAIERGVWSPEQCGSLAERFREYGMEFTAKYLQGKADKKLSLEITSELPIVVGRIWDEFDKLAWVRVDPERLRRGVEVMDALTDDVRAKFPKAVAEIIEGWECLLFERDTAAVFHVMRATESGLKVISAALGIPDPTKPAERNWGAFLRNIQEKIAENNKKPPTDWANEREFYEEIQGELVSIKNAWRNNTMHLEQRYEGAQTFNIFRATLELFRNLATRLAEPS